MLKILGLVVILGVLMVGPPTIAYAIFHDHVENLVDDLFKQKQDPIYPYPRSDEQRIINDLHSNHPKITQEDINIAYHELSDPCIQSVENPNDREAFYGCQIASRVFLTTYLGDWGYNIMIDAPTNRPPQLYIPGD